MFFLGCFKIISKNECKTEKYVFFTTNSATMKMICPNCSIDICSNCYRRDHQTNKCEEIADFEMVNFGKAIDVQNCPNCKANVEKINGCHHMTCVCNYEFCWLCNGKYNFNHYNNEYSESETSMICPFRWRQEDVLRLNMTNINMNSCYENIDLKETNKVDEFALKSLANGEFMKIDKQKRKEKSQLICFLVIGIILSPILIIIFPIYFFLMDVMMSKCWISLMRDGNCLFKTIVLFFLLCFAICFLPILWIVMISKMCGYSKMRERKDQKYILFEETV